MAEQRSSLGEGADRLERLIRGVKDRQFSEAHAAPEPKTVSNAFAVSPEETWSKKYMTAGIGPTVFKPVQMPAVPVAVPPAAAQPLKPAPMALEPAMEVQAPKPAPKVDAPPARAAAPAPAAKSAGDLRPGPIGNAIAKPGQKRSWFGRLVKGS